MKKVILTLELMLGDLSDQERDEISEGLSIAGEDGEEEVEDIPRIDEYDDEEIVSIMHGVFGDFGLTDPENSSELFAGTDFYGTIAKSKVLAVSVESVDVAGD